MAEPIFDGVSALLREGDRVTCVVRPRPGRRFWRFVAASLLVILELSGLSSTWHAMRGYAHAPPGQPHAGPGEVLINGGLTLVVTVLLTVFAMETWRRWQVRRTVFDLGARAVLDVDGERLGGLDGAAVSVRLYQKTQAGKVLDVATLVLAVASLFGGGGDVPGTEEAGLWEVLVAWPGAARVLSEPCSSNDAEALAAKLVEVGLARA